MVLALNQASGLVRGEHLGSSHTVLLSCVPEAYMADIQGGNLLSGTLPDMSAMVELRDFSAPDNQLSGTLPQACSCVSLCCLRVPFLADHGRTRLPCCLPQSPSSGVCCLRAAWRHRPAAARRGCACPGTGFPGTGMSMWHQSTPWDRHVDVAPIHAELTPAVLVLTTALWGEQSWASSPKLSALVLTTNRLTGTIPDLYRSADQRIFQPRTSPRCLLNPMPCGSHPECPGCSAPWTDLLQCSSGNDQPATSRRLP